MLGAKVIARAKINLFLEVGERREDGYHEIRSVMQSLELADELFFRRTDGSRGHILIRSNENRIPSGKENLIVQAVEAFEAHTGVSTDGGIEVFLNKRIPVGAGLAGGSADAAAAILAMDFIHELELPRETLMDIATGVGSDVPFCLAGGTALVKGRGEQVASLEPLPPIHVVLAASDSEVSTAEVYERFDELDGGVDGRPVEERDRMLEGLLEGIVSHDIEKIGSNLHNSLEPATTAVDLVEEYKATAVGAGASAALMTGSGPTVFALVTGLEEAAEVAWELEKTVPVIIITSFSGCGAQIQR